MHFSEPPIRCPARFRRRQLAAALAVIALATLAAALPSDMPASSRTGTTWYVSRNGDNTVGTSWATAWTDFARIDWSAVNPGDRIVVDGGRTKCQSEFPLGVTTNTGPGRRCGMVYRTSMWIGASGSAGAPVTIALSTSKGHDGTAVLFGGRSTPLPYCDQTRYHAEGVARTAGIGVAGQSHIVVDGSHRSGFMVYGFQSGVSLRTDSVSDVTLRNLEVFDNGTYSRWAYGYRTDGEGISLAGHDIVIDRDLVHDNGQDAIQDRDTGVQRIGHAPLHDITISNSWLYEHREHPLFPGFGFNSGAQEVPRQDCTHVDGLQIWAGGLHQQHMRFAHDVFGPFLAQGIFPGDNNTASFDRVDISDVLFLNPLDHAINGPAIITDPTTPNHWRISNVTAYLTPEPAPGLSGHGKLDLAGENNALTNSIFVNGYFAGSSITTAHGNIWWGGDPVAGGQLAHPDFVSTTSGVPWPSFTTLTALNLTPRCSRCAGAGSAVHGVADVLRRIDNLDSRGGS